MTAPRLSRRRLFERAGATVAGAAAASLAGAPALDARPRPTLRRLARTLRGPLVVPGGAGYDAAAQLWNVRLDVPPRAIAFCETPRDVARVVRFACEREWPISARSGRHSFEGYCNCRGIVADVSRMAGVVVDREAGTVRVGAGANNLSVYEDLILGAGLAIPTGTCPTVGVGGLALGGGFSHMTRTGGLLVDSMLSAKVVLADGSVVTCDERTEPALFWACRGGGGGNFGIATEFTFRTHPTPDLTTFGLTFAWADAAEALAAWQRSIPTAPAALAESTFRAIKAPPATGSGPDQLKATCGGIFYGSQSDLRDLLGPLLAAGPLTTSVQTVPFAQAWKPDGCTVQPGGGVTCDTTLYPNYQRSDFVREPLSAAAIETMLAWIERWPGGAGSHEGGVQIEAIGPPSVVNHVPARATAFVHRDALSHIVYLNFWGEQDPPAVARANIAWARGIYAAMRPYVSGFSYQNYIDRGLEDWEDAYYGVNYPRLQRIKARYDPDGLFRFAQGVRPAR